MESALYLEPVLGIVTDRFEHLRLYKLQRVKVALIAFGVGGAICLCEILLAELLLKALVLLQMFLLIFERGIMIVLLGFQTLL